MYQSFGVLYFQKEGQKSSRFHSKYLHLCFEDEQKEDDRIFLSGRTIPLNIY